MSRAKVPITMLVKLVLGTGWQVHGWFKCVCGESYVQQYILRRICERADVYTCSCLSVYVCRVVIVVSIKDFRKWQHIHDTFAVFVYRKIFPVLTHTYIYIRICDVVREGYMWIIVAKRRCVKITTLSSGIRLLVVASMSTFKC